MSLVQILVCCFMSDESFDKLLLNALRDHVRISLKTKDEPLGVHVNEDGPALESLPVVTFAHTLQEDWSPEHAARLFAQNIVSRAGLRVCGVAVASASFENMNQCKARVVIISDRASHLQLW